MSAELSFLDLIHDLQARVAYLEGHGSPRAGSGNGFDADTVDTFHAANTATANTLLALDADKDLHLGTGDLSATTVDVTGQITAPTVDVTGQIMSTLATGTAPLVVTSTTVNTNLNADMVDGIHANTTAVANKLLALDADMDLHLDTGDISGADARLTGSLGVGNLVAATTLGSVIKGMEVFNAAGVSQGHIPIYDMITNVLTLTGALIDTRLSSGAPTTNLGTNTNLYIGEYNAGVDVSRTLIKFDLSSLPTDATIVSITLSLYCDESESNNARTFRVYRTKRAWTSAGATWNKYDGTNNWSTAGGFHPDDCEQTDIGERAFTATETINVYKDFALTPTTKAALDLGNGWLIKADTETNDSYRFLSSDSASNKPKLVIKFL